MAERLEFELVSPEQLLVSQPAEMVVIPGGEGYYGVLAGHIPMITTVKPGVIEMYNEGHVTDRIFVTGGFTEVSQTRCTVLVDSAVKVRQIDREKAEQDVRNFKEDVEDATNETEREAAEARLEIARARFEAVVRFGGPQQTPSGSTAPPSAGGSSH